MKTLRPTTKQALKAISPKVTTQKVAIVVTQRCQASSVFVVTDLLMAANYALSQYFNEQTPLFQYELVGLNTRTQAYNGQTISGIVPITKCQTPDIVILPGAFESVLPIKHTQKHLAALAPMFKHIHNWHTAGAMLASVCTGNFLLAASNIANGRTLSCHWASFDTAQALFPMEDFDCDKLVIDHGDIVSIGGAMAVSQLVLYLINRLHSRELALATGKLMMVELNFNNQSRFAMFRPSHQHGDDLVSQLQKLIESHYQQELALATFAEQHGIGERQLARRFKKATGETPLGYLQRFRVEQVKIALESTKTPANNLIWQVGYEDPTSFRRLFKRLTGLTMLEYRQRFSIHI
jgi:transcriptional regulator GlxA family with amidase domain